MAYLDLGIAYSNLNETKLAFQNLQKAYELRNRLTQRERLVIEAHYYGLATGDLDKAIQTAQNGLRATPEIMSLTSTWEFLIFGSVNTKRRRLRCGSPFVWHRPTLISPTS